jgi:hypothetical protein
MRKFLLVVIIFMIANFSFSAEVTINKAKLIALNWMNLRGGSVYALDDISSVFIKEGVVAAEYFIVSFKPVGWVIVSGSDLTEPVLGYSTNTGFDVENIPPQVQGWMGGISEEVKMAEKNRIMPSPTIRDKWNDYGSKVLGKSSLKSVASTLGGPLLSCTWNQGRYYNEMAPADPLSSTGNGHVWVGCVATAIAQVMKYWSYPSSGMGYHNYYHPDYGDLFADFGNTTYNWSAMPNNVNSHNPEVQRLNYHAAVAVDMDFGPYSSGAYLDQANSGLINYFRYNSTIFEASKNRWDNDEWTALLKREIDAGRPVVYSGYNATYTSGHAWVCDGYSSGDYFHFNWGWGGTYNGNYLLSSLSPGSYNFSYDQAALFSIEPVQPASIPIPYSQGFESGAGAISLMGVAGTSSDVMHTGAQSLRLGKESITSYSTNAISLCFVVPADAELNFWVKRSSPQISNDNQQMALLMPQYGSTPLAQIFSGDYNDSDWVSYNVDLSAYTGQIVRLLITQQVNDLVRQQWMYVDDISISGISSNLAPYLPSSPIPSNLQDYVELNPTLRWNGGDPNGDNLTYKIYFGTQPDPPFVASSFNNYYTPQTLTHLTTYYWKIVSEDGSLTTNGPVWSFKTKGIPPDVGLCGLENLTSNSATICGEILNENSTAISARGICWTETSIPSLSTENKESTGPTTVFSCNIDGLLPYTVYNYAAFANSNQGIAYSSIQSVRTLPAKPEVAFVEVKDILRTSATVEGKINTVNDEAILKRGVVWSTTGGFDPAEANEIVEEGNWGNIGNFQVKLNNLPGPGNIFIRVFAENSAGRSYSDDTMFITPNLAPFIDLDANNSRGAGDSDFKGDATEQLAGGVICDNDVVVTDADGDQIVKIRIEITNPVDAQMEELVLVAEFTDLIVNGNGTSLLELSSATSFSNSQWCEILRNIEYRNQLDNPRKEIERRISVKIFDGLDWSNIAMAKITVVEVNDPPVVQALPKMDKNPLFGSNISVIPGIWDDLLDNCSGTFTFKYWFQAKDADGLIEDIEADSFNLLNIDNRFCGKVIRVVEEITDNNCGGNNNVTNWAAGEWIPVERTSQTIVLDAIPLHYFHEQNFTVGGRSSSGLPISFSVPENKIIRISNDTVYMLNTGSVIISGMQPGNNCYQPSSVLYKPVNIARGNQEIIFDSPVGASYADYGIELPARATSGLQLTVASSDSSIAYANSDSIFFNGTGTVTITLSQLGNANYFSAPTVSVQLIVHKGNQTITSNPISGLVYGQQNIPLIASATSLLAVEVTSSDPSIVEVLGDSLKVKGVGTAMLSFVQGGNEFWNPANAIEMPVIVRKGSQDIIVDEIGIVRFTDQQIQPRYYSTSGLDVELAVTDTSIATIVDQKILIKDAGETSILFYQPGNSLWEPVSKELPLTIAKADQEISLSPIGSNVFGIPEIVVAATATSGLPVSFVVSDTTVATVDGDKLIIHNAGLATITAHQTGNGQWNEASPVSVDFEIGKALQTIVSNLPDSVSMSENKFVADVLSSSGLPVAITSSNENILTVKGDTLVLIAPGEVLLFISQPGNRNFQPVSIEDKLVIYEPVAVSTLSKIEYVVYPNPSTGFFTISSNREYFQRATMTISTLTGKKILQSELTGSIVRIDMSGYPQGIYFITINSLTNSFNQKLLLKGRD